MKNRISIKIKNGGSAVYLLKNKSKVIYVGQSSRVIGRFGGHLNKVFDEVEIIWTPLKMLAKLENLLIRKHRPKLNTITNDWSEHKETLAALGRGDSFLVHGITVPLTTTWIHWARTRYPCRKFVSRTIDAGVRIWRTK